MQEAILNNPDIEVFDQIKRTQCLQTSRILVFQSIATAILVYGVMGSQYTAQPYPHLQNYQPSLNLNHSIYQSCALFLALCFSGQLTGAHCNPAVTLALWICQENRLKFPSALLYFVSQFIGALIGGLCAWALIPTFEFDQQVPINSPNQVLLQLRVLFAQICGSFIYCFFLLIVSHEKTSFVKSTFWNYMLIPLAFFIAREVTYQTDSLNPATTLSFQLFTGIKLGNWAPLQQYYLYFVGPIVGAVLSSGCYNFFYLPLLLRWKSRK